MRHTLRVPSYPEVIISDESIGQESKMLLVEGGAVIAWTCRQGLATTRLGEAELKKNVIKMDHPILAVAASTVIDGAPAKRGWLTRISSWAIIICTLESLLLWICRHIKKRLSLPVRVLRRPYLCACAALLALTLYGATLSGVHVYWGTRHFSVEAFAGGICLRYSPDDIRYPKGLGAALDIDRSLPTINLPIVNASPGPGGWERELRIPLWVFLSPLVFPAICCWRMFRRRLKGLCLQCGYRVTSVNDGRCPECGRSVRGNDPVALG